MIELLITLSTLGLLFAMVLPAIQRARESMRRTECQNHLRQLSIASMNFESTYGHWPLGTSHKTELLPFLGEIPEDKNHSISSSPGLPKGISQERPATIPAYLRCPADPGAGAGNAIFSDATGTNYHGNAGVGVLGYGFNGVFGYGDGSNDLYPDHLTRTRDITDGLSNTAGFSEALLPNTSLPRVTGVWLSPREYFQPEEFTRLIDYCDSVAVNESTDVETLISFPRGFPWQGGGMGMALYTHSLTPNRASCINGRSVMTGIFTATSLHPMGVNLAFADGHVQFISQQIDPKIWSAYGSRSSAAFEFPF